MARKAAPSRNRRRRLGPVLELEDETPKLAFDGADIAAGLVLAFALPVLTLVLLAAGGMRLSGGESLTVEERLAREEELSRRTAPPLRTAELELRTQYVDRLLRENAQIYLKRFRDESEPREKNLWYKRAFTVFSSCDEILETLQTQMEKTPGSTNPMWLQQVRERRSRIQKELSDLDRNKPFLDG